MKKKFTLFKIAVALLGLSISTNAQNISTVAGNGSFGSTGDGGPATSAKLSNPGGICLDISGNLYIADMAINTIRKVNISTGIITTVAGNGTNGYSGDGGAATSAQLKDPSGVCVDFSGNIYIADQSNNRIRKVTASTGIITTVAGNGTYGFSGDGFAATSAQMKYPYGIAVDASGNLYVADNINHRIRKITASTGIISTIAGNGSATYSGDGAAATSAAINNPSGVCLDASGNVYIADFLNNRIRKVTISTGMISTVAGNGLQGYSGDAGPAISAKLDHASGLCVDASGDIYIADRENSRIRKVNVATGIIYTVAGIGGTGGYNGDGILATSAELNQPDGICLDAAGNGYIADVFNSRIRKVNAITSITDLTSTQTIFIFPNPSNGKFQFKVDNLQSKNYQLEVYNALGEKVLEHKTSNEIDLSNSPKGVYFVKVITGEKNYTQKLIVE